MTTTTRVLAAAAGCAVLLLAGCSSDEAAPAATSTSAAADGGVALADGSEGQGGMGQPGEGGFGDGEQRGGLTGEIAYVSDGVAQVQDGSTQTAVSFGDDTTVEAEVTLDLSDIAVGACVVAVLGDDDTATSISVTEPDEDGECSAGFGGMGGMPGGGEMPTDMPTAMPEDGEAPADMPTAMPEDGEMPEGGFDMGGFVSGTVAAVSSDGLTVTDSEGEGTAVVVGDETAITGTEDADASAIVTGMCLTARGEADSSGGYAATTITVFDGGDEGCIAQSGFAGGPGGMGGERPDMGEMRDPNASDS